MRQAGRQVSASAAKKKTNGAMGPEAGTGQGPDRAGRGGKSSRLARAASWGTVKLPMGPSVDKGGWVAADDEGEAREQTVVANAEDAG